MTDLTDSSCSNESNWHYLQIKGDMGHDQPKDEDIVSAVEFNHDGQFLATGDRGGRIVIFQRDTKSDKMNRDYNCYISFQSHEPKFDYLKSLEIDEGIVQIKWIRPMSDSILLLTTNTKTIKLWKISEKTILDRVDEISEDDSLDNDSDAATKISEPKFQERRIMDCVAKKIYDNVHAYTVNSISVSSDHEHFISTDDLRIYLWNLHVTGTCFKIVDIKPEIMENLRDVITCSVFHPTHGSLMVYGISRGLLNLCDLRERSVFAQPSLTYENFYAPHTAHYEIQETMHDMLNSFSDVRYSSDGLYLMARDYIGIRIWDQRMASRPCEYYPVQSFLKNLMEPIYENQLFLNRFDCVWSPDNKSILTGSYSDLFTIIPRKCSENNMDPIHQPSHSNLNYGSDSRSLIVPVIDNLTEFHNYYYQPSLSDFCTRSSCRIASSINRKVILSSSPYGQNNTNDSMGLQNSSSSSYDAHSNTETDVEQLSERIATFSMDDRIYVENLEMDRRVSSCDWHPSENIVSLAVHNHLFLLYQKKQHFQF